MNMKQTKFKENDLPYSEFQKLGLSKADILSLDKNSLEALLSGKRTNLLNIKAIDSKGELLEFKGKLSISRNPDNSVGVNIHPVRQEIKNDIGLKPDELEKLKKSQLVAKVINGEKCLVQLDKQTNEILIAKVKNITIPSHIKDVELSSTQKNNLKQGLPITIDSGKETLQVGLDLNSPRGLKLTDESFDQKQKVDFDDANPQIIGTVQTDKNISEFVDYQKKHENKNNNPLKM